MSSIPYYGKVARRLVYIEGQASGLNQGECIKRIAGDLRVSAHSIWSLLHRPPKSINDRVKAALNGAVIALIGREIADLEAELVGTRDGRLVRTSRELAEIETDLAGLKSRLAQLRGRV